MKRSARVALIAALATTAPTWASLPFYSPPYTYDSTTGTGYTYMLFENTSVTPDGRAASTMEYIEPNVIPHNHLVVTWRGQMPLPTPQQDAGHSNPALLGMNRNGWICGITEQVPHEDWLPALWRPDGSRIDLPLIPASLDSIQGNNLQGFASAMNDAGFTVGWSDKVVDSFGTVRQRPVCWTPSGEIVELANPSASSNTLWEGEAVSISSTGIIAGSIWSHGDAMKWDVNGTATLLSHTTDTGITYPYTRTFEALDDGTILGYGSNSSGHQYGILWTPNGEAIDLRALPDSDSQWGRTANALNNNHYSVGRARNSFGQDVGVRWSPSGEPFALDRLADAPINASHSASDINDFNFAVGRSVGSSTYRRAVLWTPDGDAIDLNSLIESGDEWNFFSATTITNTGWISGVGVFDPEGPAVAYDRPFSILVPFAGTYGMGDANFDESIDFADLLIVAQNYGSETNGSFDVGDFNLDGSVDFTDLLAIAQNYGNVLGDATGLLPNSPNPTFESDWQAARAMVPEPNLIGGLIGVGVMLRRRR